MSDVVRLLHRRSERGYTSEVAKALPGAGEAPSADFQDELAARARRRERDAQRREWESSRAELQRGLDRVYAQRLGRDVVTQLRAIQRQIDRIDVSLRRV